MAGSLFNTKKNLNGEKMKTEGQKIKLVETKAEVECLLRKPDKDAIRKLLLLFARPGVVRRIYSKDPQLFALNHLCNIWLQEQKKPSGTGALLNIFENIDSLEGVEKKYTIIKLMLLRLEAELPVQCCIESVERLIDNHVSGIALHYMIQTVTWSKENNIVFLARLLKDQGAYGTAVTLLQEGETSFPGSYDILMGLADCWLAGAQWEQARNCLARIRKPAKDVIELMKELEKVITDEAI